MFGLNKKLKQASQKPTKSKAKPNDKQVATSTAASKTKTSIAAIPDLICKVFLFFFHYI